MTNALTTARGSITVRVATANDAASLRELRLEALAGSPQSFAADYETSARESVEDWVERLTKNAADDNNAICVAFASDRLIGMAGVSLGRWPKTRHAAMIWGVYVNPAWRGLHVAEALIQECADWSKERGGVIVKLGVIASNAPAIRCYTRCGFNVYGVEPKVIFHNETYHDELLMVKPI